ncbi:U6 snRNA-associated Sm-like protein LSm8 [Fusarium sp. LHS14.1]|nr:U6 snRNA-associated Sm-like protein LSm8 [Fusarium sp. LHS14.1]
MATLGGYLNKKVLIVTADSRILVGTLAACDNTTNLVGTLPLLHCSLRLPIPSQVLNNAIERIIRTPDDPEPSAQVPLGLYLVRGDNVCSIGLVDEALDDSINWTEVKGSAIGGIKHI